MTPSPSTPDVAPLPPRAEAVARQIDLVVIWSAWHWLLLLIGYGLLVVGVAALAPILRANGFGPVATLTYLPYRLICHQRADRSFHIHGEQMAFCERDTAIVGAAVVVALLYACLRGRFRVAPLSLTIAILFAIPMAVDGGTQLVGLRESTPQLRLLTGALFSVGLGLYVLPRLESAFADLRDDIVRRLEAPAQ